MVAHAERLGIPDFTASSAGTHAVIGHPIHPNAAAVPEEFGGALVRIRCSPAHQKIASGADLILTMTRAHRDAVLEIAPNKLRRTFTLPESVWLVEEKMRAWLQIWQRPRTPGDGATADVLDHRPGCGRVRHGRSADRGNCCCRYSNCANDLRLQRMITDR